MKKMKYVGIMLLIVMGVLLFIDILPHRDRAGRFDDAVMIDNELYFILGKEQEVEGVAVYVSSIPLNTNLVMWAEGAGDNKHLKANQIKYGQKIEGFLVSHAPEELRKNIKYFATVFVSGCVFPGTRVFTIIDDNEVMILPRPGFEKPFKNRTIIIERNGRKITVPYSASFDKDGNKVIVSEPGIR